MFQEPSEDPDVMIDINTTPLIDVMLVLLIMLIITIPLQTHSVKLDMPQGPPPQATVLPEVARIDIDAQGVITWNGDKVADRADLEARLHQAAIAANPPEIHVRPHKAVAYAHVAGVMAAAQHQGVTKLGVVGAEQFLE
ncbi:Biopolymer transport protein ExbD/TolR [Paramagnetospirillum magnetotacticum MS-1]|uniref:Biopolymer transport protein ExbD/TolR n=1 Tax=Paramagnetospirillum magnetotacticum MS-1 TaxID=272627 RepID=A0A0C2YHS2_PARME|nr:biopolymer transporter ExbD [Paramagnetospirillum magnetotacticum]KIL99309.1 Biopolymer transport protein ExbD/TolR [Paramagnetospirillum magnetotacticum MS-1]